MSVVDQLKNLFSKKQLDSELDSRLSLAMPDVTIVNTDNEMQPESRNAPLQGAAAAAVEEAAPTEGDLITIPVLGRKTVVEHQRTLFVLLGAH
jgi:twitching motility protein PilJ